MSTSNHRPIISLVEVIFLLTPCFYIRSDGVRSHVFSWEQALVNKQMSLSVKDGVGRMPQTLRTVNHAALNRKKLIVWVSKGMLARVWIPIEGLMFIVTGCYIDCLSAVAFATLTFCSKKHFCYWNRHRLLSTPQWDAQFGLPQTIYWDNNR